MRPQSLKRGGVLAGVRSSAMRRNRKSGLAPSTRLRARGIANAQPAVVDRYESRRMDTRSDSFAGSLSGHRTGLARWLDRGPAALGLSAPFCDAPCGDADGMKGTLMRYE